MRKLILALLAMGTIATANAQEPKSILLYGDAGVASNRLSNLDKNTNWNVRPGVGYQFNHNWTLGLNIGWGQDGNKNGTTNIKTTDNFYRAGAFARYSRYIRKSETFFWFAQFEFGYAGGYTTVDGNPATNKHTGIYTNLFPALGINVGRGLALNFSIGGIGYATDKYTSAVYSDNSFSLTFGQQANFGISKNFNVGHKMHSHHEPGDEVHRRRADRMEDEDDAAPKPRKRERSRDDDE